MMGEPLAISTRAWKWPARLGPRWGVYALLLVAAALYAAPIVWMLATSIKPESQALGGSLRLTPDPMSSTLAQAAENYSAVWNDRSIDFPLYLRNTLIVTLLGVTGMTLSTAVVAYGFSRVAWRGRGFFFTLVLATLMVPFPVIMGPLYVVFSKLGWIGTLLPLWAPAWLGGSFHGAFNIFLLRQFFMGIPKELDEAARIDGCSHWGIFWRVILPMSKPALAVVSLLYFVYLWNDFLGPLLFLTHRDQFTLALGLHLYQSKAGNTPWSLLMAASAMVALPVLAVFLVAQRTFVQGIATEGLKD